MPQPDRGPSRAWRLLAPAPTASGGQSSSGTAVSNNQGPTHRINLVKNACRNCQVKKTKCDGKRPRCSRCDARKLECVFETRHEGMTKQQSADFEIARLQAIIADYEDKFRILQHGTDDEAQSMLALIRQNVQSDETHDNSSVVAQQVHDPLQETTTVAASSSRSSPEISDADDEHDFLPLLFNRRDWKREPTPNNDDSVDLERLAAAQDQQPEEIADPSINFPQSDPVNEPSPSHANNFRNLPFSSAILANHQPPYIQQQQHANMFESIWSILPLTTLPGAASVKDSISSTIQQARLLIQAGESMDQVAGTSCNIAAIFDQEQYNQATLLSKWAARLVFSVQRKKRGFVVFASMHVAWLLARWMIDPKLENFLAIPEWYRPTMAQLYMPHVELVDFLLWPLLRETITSNPDTLQRDWRWLEDMSRTIDCDWFINVDLALENDSVTGEIYLVDSAKACAEDLDNWS
ncbi:hypothetical protein E8E14_014244 [Neopestalotiopsis sp. 37M]|nr:hypothetical protein E8E14_014244 [Neopestalotiopsis sp. 37M]